MTDPTPFYYHPYILGLFGLFFTTLNGLLVYVAKKYIDKSFQRGLERDNKFNDLINQVDYLVTEMEKLLKDLMFYDERFEQHKERDLERNTNMALKISDQCAKFKDHETRLRELERRVDIITNTHNHHHPENRIK